MIGGVLATASLVAVALEEVRSYVMLMGLVAAAFLTVIWIARPVASETLEKRVQEKSTEYKKRVSEVKKEDEIRVLCDANPWIDPRIPATSVIVLSKGASEGNVSCEWARPRRHRVPKDFRRIYKTVIEYLRLQMKTERKGVEFFDANAARLLDAREDRHARIRLRFQRTRYFEGQVTNFHFWLSVDKKSVREHLGEPRQLVPLNRSRAGNHLGVSLLLDLPSGEVLTFQRSGSVAVGSMEVGASVSASMSYWDRTWRFSPSPFAAIRRETRAELGIKPKDLVPDSLLLLGIVRILERMGKPEACFRAETNLTLNEVQERLRRRIRRPREYWEVRRKESGMYHLQSKSVQELTRLLDAADTSATFKALILLYLRWRHSSRDSKGP